MATGKITITSLRDLRGWLWDSTVVGFGARRQTNGVFYYLRYRQNGSQQMRSIGRHGSPWTPDTARIEAKRLLGALAGGSDPFAQSLAGEGFTNEVERYLERKRVSLKPRSFVEVSHHLRKQAALSARFRLAEIDRRKIAALLAEVEGSSGPIARNRLRSSLSSFFAWCVTEGLLDVNPVLGTAKASEGGSRDRVLGVSELKKLWVALSDLSSVSEGFADIVRLLVLTGQRREEIGGLRWAEINLKDGVIVLPPARTKNKRQHELPLSRQALAILEGQSRRNSTSTVFGSRGFQDWSRSKTALDQGLKLTAWRLHDLRRTAATGMAELGVQPHIVEAVLNHVSGHKAGLAGIYNRARYEGEMRDALQRWADHVEQITKV